MIRRGCGRWPPSPKWNWMEHECDDETGDGARPRDRVCGAAPRRSRRIDSGRGMGTRASADPRRTGLRFRGSRLPWSLQALAASVPDRAGAIVLGHDERVNLLESAFLNGTFIQGFELDDYHRDGPLHSSSVVLPAIFAASLRAGDLTLRDLLRAAIRGYETGPRLGMALGGGRVTVSGYHMGGVFGPAAAAMAAAAILRLSPAQTADAFEWRAAARRDSWPCSTGEPSSAPTTASRAWADSRRRF